MMIYCRTTIIFLAVLACLSGCVRRSPSAEYSIHDLMEYMRADSPELRAVMREKDRQARLDFWDEYQRGETTSLEIVGPTNDGTLTRRMIIAEGGVVTELFQVIEHGWYPDEKRLSRRLIDWIHLMRKVNGNWVIADGESRTGSELDEYLIRYRTSDGSDSGF